ncbi:hypothetical protein [Celeribacter litoreus]|uniref:hypothetical protein n=1 Tax=Celeribacter litoreus TaxID=2876714 RepID=UPI001CCF890B|nr:hypothetical protein [Celeribacter litoreus]MCA0042639.1 hypothetical protein [Celeribacter litoreus]
MTQETNSKTSPLARLDAAQMQAVQLVLGVIVLILATAFGRSGILNAHFAMIGQIFGAFWMALAAMQLVQAVQKDDAKAAKAKDE